MLDVLSRKLRDALDALNRKVIVDERAVREVVKEIQKGLILSDVDINIVISFSKRVEERALRETPLPGLSIREHVISIIYDELVAILGGGRPALTLSKGKTTKLLLVGLQGSGKTTTAAKLAKYFKEQGYSVGLFSTDTYRPAAREQLRQLASLIGAKFFDAETNDSLELARRGIEYFTNENVDIVIVDTAGRHSKEEDLLIEMELLEDVIRPDYTFLVIDASIGQQAYRQAKAFSERTRIGGIIVTKLDGTAKGGGALSAVVATGAKIYFIGTGETLECIEPYDPHAFIKRLLGYGDIESLLRKIEATKLSRERLLKIKEVSRGELTLIDLIEQFEEIRKLGGLYKFISMFPGLGRKLSKDKINELEMKVRAWKYAIDSMTDEERAHPEVIKGSRISRIAKGSGTDEATIRELLKHYHLVKKLLKSGKQKKMLKMLGFGLRADLADFS